MTETNDTIKEIPLDEETKEEVQKEIKEETKVAAGPRQAEIKEETPQIDFVDAKPISELTDIERAIIIKNAKEGLDQPNYSVTFFKNGNCRIKKKKEPKPTVSQKVTKTQATQPKDKETKVYYSDNQLLFEHIIELNARLERLTAKQKKLKNKVKDMYVDENDINEDEEEQAPSTFQQQIPQGRVSWRNRVKYI